MSIAPYSELLLFANNAQSTLAGSITNSQTSLAVQSGGGALFPNPAGGQAVPITLVDAATGVIREIVLMSSRVGDTFTIVRAQEGTVGLPWSAGDIVAQLVTAGGLTTFLQIAAAQAQSFNFADDAGVINAYQVTLNPAIATNVEGMPIRLKVARTNTGASTLDAGAGPSPVRRRDGSAFIGGEWVAGDIVEVRWSSAGYYIYDAIAPATAAAITSGTDTQSAVTPAQLAAAIFAVAPPGMMAGYGGSVAPTGWLLCLGTSVLRTDYPNLFTAIGTNFGSVDGLHFNVPDMRGRVLAMIDATGLRLTGATMTPNGNTLGATGGQQTESAAVSVSVSVGVSGTTGGSLSVSTTSVNMDGPNSATEASSFTGGTFLASTTHTHANVVSSGATSGSLAVSATGTGSGSGSTNTVTNVQPTLLANWMIKT